eukprot:2420154-Amphidinium_carterae.1
MAAASAGFTRDKCVLKCTFSNLEFDLSSGHDEHHKHLLRDFLRDTALHRVAARRLEEYDGLQRGVDRVMSL